MDQQRIEAVAEYHAAMSARDWKAATQHARATTPLNNQMGITILEKDDAGIVLTMELSDSVRGLADGTVHGGILATFADIASAFVLEGSYDETQLPVTTDMHIRYYRQPHSGPLRAEATLVHRGKRLLSCECAVTDADHRVLSRSTATYMLVSRPGSGAS
jgi:uncharacterized protein (TIGR00369 family)